MSRPFVFTLLIVADLALLPAPLCAGEFASHTAPSCVEADPLHRRLDRLQLGQRSKYGYTIVFPSPPSPGLQVLRSATALVPGTTFNRTVNLAHARLSLPSTLLPSPSPPAQLAPCIA